MQHFVANLVPMARLREAVYEVSRPPTELWRKTRAAS
jgi:hypothetical protein